MFETFEKIKANDYDKYFYNRKFIKEIKICDMSVKYSGFDKNEIDLGQQFYVPFTYIQYDDDKSIIIQSFPEFMDIAFDFIGKFCDNLFSQDAFDYLDDILAEELKKSYNIVPNEELYDRYSIVYGMNSKNMLNLSRTQDSTIKFNESTEYDVIEGYSYNKNIRGLYYGTLIGNKIVSVASWNNYEYFTGNNYIVIDIGCGTHENYRKRGYAVSNVVAMAEHILDSGLCATYSTNNKNTASQNTAKAAGFVEVCKRKTFYFKNE
ncbi:MAG: GNAT family N-acetyltransferase [Oscillospiraceae bacterium]|nr:GNAT family N-acetyltransferase [Oscillospiraceae bacterium]